MTNKYAVVSDGVVINTVLWDGDVKWHPEQGGAIVAGDDVGIGWLYEEGKFTPPPSPSLTHEEHVVIAEQKKSELISLVATTTAMWRAELLLGVIGDEDKSKLNEWILFHREVQSIDTEMAPDIEWPELPTLYIP